MCFFLINYQIKKAEPLVVRFDLYILQNKNNRCRTHTTICLHNDGGGDGLYGTRCISSWFVFTTNITAQN